MGASATGAKGHVQCNYSPGVMIVADRVKMTDDGGEREMKLVPQCFT